jgi:hypothetical protein
MYLFEGSNKRDLHRDNNAYGFFDNPQQQMDNRD